MTRKNILLLAGAGVALVLLAIATVLLVKGIRKFREAEADLSRAQVALDGYYAHDPFPSRENVGLERTNVDTLREWFGKIRDALREGQIEEVHKSPSTFMTLLSEKRNALVRRARAVWVALPENFAFGFDRYSAEGVLPAPGDVPRLTQQLMIVERLSEVLLEERVRGIESIERVVSEQGAEGAAMSGTPEAAAGRGRGRRPMRRPTASQTKPATLATGEVRTEDLYASQHVVLAFTVNEASLIRVLNRLASDAMFVVVTRVQMKKERDDVVLPSLTVENTPLADEGASPAEGEATVKEALPRRERVVSGPDREVPLNVRVELDVYRFMGD